MLCISGVQTALHLGDQMTCIVIILDHGRWCGIIFVETSKCAVCITPTVIPSFWGKDFTFSVIAIPFQLWSCLLPKNYVGVQWESIQ